MRHGKSPTLPLAMPLFVALLWTARAWKITMSSGWLRGLVAMLVSLACTTWIFSTVISVSEAWRFQDLLKSDHLAQVVGLLGVVGAVIAFRSVNLVLTPQVAKGTCPGCGYDMRGNTSGRCPECGRPSAPSGPIDSVENAPQ
jgi:predicted Zn-ribbon and HTH transcriptional regulator